MANHFDLFTDTQPHTHSIVLYSLHGGKQRKGGRGREWERERGRQTRERGMMKYRNFNLEKHRTLVFFEIFSTFISMRSTTTAVASSYLEEDKIANGGIINSRYSNAIHFFNIS